MLAEYLTIRDLCKYLKVRDSRTVERWLQEKNIHILRIGRQKRVSLEALRQAGLDTKEDGASAETRL